MGLGQRRHKASDVGRPQSGRRVVVRRLHESRRVAHAVAVGEILHRSERLRLVEIRLKDFGPVNSGLRTSGYVVQVMTVPGVIVQPVEQDCR